MMNFISVIVMHFASNEVACLSDSRTENSFTIKTRHMTVEAVKRPIGLQATREFQLLNHGQEISAAPKYTEKAPLTIEAQYDSDLSPI